MPDLTHLNAEALNRFLENDLKPFITDLEKIQEDDPVKGVALHTLPSYTTPSSQQQSPFLTIGLLGGDQFPAGSTLLKKLKEGASSVDEIFDFQHKLFTTIDGDLNETISTLLKKQGDSLESIDGQKMLDIFVDVDNLQSTPPSGGQNPSGS